MINQIRGFLLERGIAFPKGPANLRKKMVILEDAERNLAPPAKAARRYLAGVEATRRDIANISEEIEHIR